MKADEAEAELRKLQQKRRALAAPGPFSGLMKREADRADRRRAEKLAREAEEADEAPKHFVANPVPDFSTPPAHSLRPTRAEREARAARTLAAAAAAPRCATAPTAASDHRRNLGDSTNRPRPKTSEAALRTRRKLAADRKRWDAWCAFKKRGGEPRSPDPREEA